MQHLKRGESLTYTIGETLTHFEVVGGFKYS